MTSKFQDELFKAVDEYAEMYWEYMRAGAIRELYYKRPPAEKVKSLILQCCDVKAFNLAIGALSTYGDNTDEHPQTLVEYFIKEAEEGEK